MTNEEIVAFQAKERAFSQTEIGRLFNAFDRAAARAWQLDTQAGWADNVSDKRLRDVWDAERHARQEFRNALDVLMADGPKGHAPQEDDATRSEASEGTNPSFQEETK